MIQASNLKETLEYYQINAEKYFKQTVSIDVTSLYKPFLKLMPENGMIFDAGCGAGRDTHFFKKHGFDVVAFDNSSKMIKLASDFTDQDIKIKND